MQTMTELIMQSSSPWNNPYQGNDKKVLFVCSAGILRSATGARLYARKYNTRACGSEHYALIRISPDLILWADEIVFVKNENYKSALEVFPAIKEHRSVKVLNIPDNYCHMDPNLIKHFEEQYERIEA